VKFIQTEIAGVHLVDMEPIEDERGFFARAFCQREFSRAGLDFSPVQANFSYNYQQGTLRGMHYQVPPHGEDKLIRVVRGAIFDVALDLRPESETYCHWVGFHLSAENRRSLYLPQGCAHGYLTLADDCEVYYLVSAEYSPKASRVVRWNDPTFGIEWPMASPRVISDNDRNAMDFRP
jgi:dTDP-4-dehydrorhamnose 3,5-epimerase